MLAGREARHAAADLAPLVRAQAASFAREAPPAQAAEEQRRRAMAAEIKAISDAVSARFRSSVPQLSSYERLLG